MRCFLFITIILISGGAIAQKSWTIYSISGKFSQNDSLEFLEQSRHINTVSIYNISNTDFGRIPFFSISDTNLHSLSIFSVAGEIDLTRLKKFSALNHLVLYQVNATSYDFINEMLRLQSLTMDECNLTSLPACLCKLDSLRYLSIGNNPDLSEIPYCISNLRLKELVLAGSEQVLNDSSARFLNQYGESIHYHINVMDYTIPNIRILYQLDNMKEITLWCKKSKILNEYMNIYASNSLEKMYINIDDRWIIPEAINNNPRLSYLYIQCEGIRHVNSLNLASLDTIELSIVIPRCNSGIPRQIFYYFKEQKAYRMFKQLPQYKVMIHPNTHHTLYKDDSSLFYR
jgi:Leucine-rich repeat (LRR) protein